MPRNDGTSGAATGRTDPPPRLFVYGSLRAGETGEMAALLHRHSRHLGAGTIRAGLYAVAGYSVAAPCDEPDAVVHGDLFELDPAAAGPVLAGLDAYEGDGYRRVEVEVRMADETSLGAQAYLCAASVAGLRRIVHGDWRRERDEAGGAPLANSGDTG
ncbi:MAG: gamma-glutamylcyclotransferase [Longimicrobiaceae bacterium]